MLIQCSRYLLISRVSLLRQKKPGLPHGLRERSHFFVDHSSRVANGHLLP